MAFSSGRLRSFVRVAAVCVMALSATQTAEGQASGNTPGTGSVAGSLQGSCGVSDGDKAFGIQAIADDTCADGGLGCYDDHCRYCKIIDTLQSAHLESCKSLGASFPSMAPLTASTGPCTVSSGDAAGGVGAMSDPTCLYGGLGCFSDHCRFCQSKSTPQSSQFLPCTWVKGSSSGSTHNAEAAEASSMMSGSGVAGTATVCTMTPSSGDAALGINITTDASCANGGVGCITSLCRFCSAKNTPQSSYLNACPTPAAAANVCTTTVSSGDAAVGINIVTDATCVNGGIGCIDNLCRFCRKTTTTQSAAYVDCALFGSTSSAIQVPATTTPAPTTAAPVTSAPTTQSPSACTQTVSDGDAANGIRIVTDASCSSGGLGCIDQVCRFCKVATTTQSASFVDCATITGSATQAPTATTTPTPTTAAPVTSAPTTQSPSACTQTVSDGDAANGIRIVTDASCSSGGLGCIDQVCRFCKVATTTQSASFVDCATITGSATQAPIATTTTPPPTSAPTASSSTPSIVFVCSRTVSSGDNAVGLDIVSDIRCSDGGTGCVSDVCRFCKRFDTVQSQSYLNCSTIPSSNVGADITFVPIPVVDDSAPSTRVLASANGMGSSDSVVITHSTIRDLEATTANDCTMTVSTGDAAVGINIVADTSCSSGGVGCIDNICRYCKTKDTTQSANFNSCPTTSTTRPSTTPTPTTKVCTTTASDGDIAVGINITTDPSCANGGLGCMDSVCRLCKTKTTDQSAHLANCSSIISATTVATTDPPQTTIAPVMATAAPTSIPDSTTSIPLNCYQTVSNGDKSVGLDILTDIRCGDGGVGCVDSVCRFCKRFETPQSHSYMNCADIPPADIGADITFKRIAGVDDTQVPGSEDAPVAALESDEFASVPDDICSDVPLADGQAEGGVGVVLDTVHCPEGLASGCIGDAGCRYCMRFPTNTSEYLEYCAIVNSTDVPYSLSGATPSIGDGSTLSAGVGSVGTPSVGTGSISVGETASNSSIPEPVNRELIVGVVGCVGVVGIVVLAAFGIKRTIRSLTLSSSQPSDKEKVSPDNENRPSVLVTSNVDEPGIISDV